MCGLRTVLACFAVLLPVPAAADPGLPDPLRHFAACTGRLSALVEHQWRVDGPASDVTARARDAMADLMAAVTTADTAIPAMALRIETKVAHAALLWQAHHRQDRAAAARATALVAPCRGLLLG